MGLFDVVVLNDAGEAAARKLQAIFETTLREVEEVCGGAGRDMAIARTKLQEACMFAHSAMTTRPENQEVEQ